MHIPCAYKPAFIIAGFAFLRPELTNAQFQNLTMIATALILGSKFNLTEISRMWLQEKSVAALSEFLSDAKFSTIEMERLHLLNMRNIYQVTGGNFIIDDTMKHHTKLCKWIHGAQVLFDHAFGTNLKATCVVFLYYSDGAFIKFPISHRIFYQEKSPMPWRRGKQIEHKNKNELALEMLQWALENGFPKCTVLADAWFGVGPFIKGLKRLELSYIVELKSNLNVRVPGDKPKLTPGGKLSKIQYDKVNITKFFETVHESRNCGFSAVADEGKKGEGSLPNQDSQHQTQLDSREASSRGKLRPRHKDREISSNRSAHLGSRQNYFHLRQSMGNRGVLQECQAVNGYGGSHCQERTRRDNIVVPGVLD